MIKLFKVIVEKRSVLLRIVGYGVAIASLIWVLRDFHIVRAVHDMANADWRLVLAGISNVGLSSGQYSTYQYTTNAGGYITGVIETSDSPLAYPGHAQQLSTYNNLNQIALRTGQPLRYDANGNLLSDGQRDYAWDAENRLVGITYLGQPGKATTFSYDGLGRQTAISSTPAGGGTPVTTSYLW
ncbi:MAG: hypothetical protein ACRD4X_05495, partial [Candidatus Acidiferrales bacterium]